MYGLLFRPDPSVMEGVWRQEKSSLTMLWSLFPFKAPFLEMCPNQCLEFKWKLSSLEEWVFLLFILTPWCAMGWRLGGGAGQDVLSAPWRPVVPHTVLPVRGPFLLLPRPSLHFPTSNLSSRKFFPSPYLVTVTLPILEGPEQILPSSIIFLNFFNLQKVLWHCG